MKLLQKVKGWFVADEPAPAPVRVIEAAAAPQTDEEPGYRRLSGDGLGPANERDMSPMAQDRMATLAEYLWQSNLLANRMVEIPLAYLLAEGVRLECKDEAHQKLLDQFWSDPINNWPLKLMARVRALSLFGEQCYPAFVNQGNGFVRLGYLDPRQIATVVMDPDNAEQPIGVVTKKDKRGHSNKYRVVVLGDDAQLFSARTAAIRAGDFTDGECFLFQVNKLPDGSRGRSDLLAQMDWLDAYEGFLFSEVDRIDYLRRFVWDVTMTGADPKAVEAYEKTFKPPGANSTFVHNDSISLQAKTPGLQAADTSESARLLRNHTLGGATIPEHWFGGGGDVNRAAASEMGEPTFKIFTARQTDLKQMLEAIGRFVLWSAERGGQAIDWFDERWKVTARFPELLNRDLTKFAAAMAQVSTTVVLLIAEGLLTQERALQLIADIAARFGQEIDAKAELAAAKAEHAARQAERDQRDVFNAGNLPADVRDAAAAAAAPSGEPGDA